MILSQNMFKCQASFSNFYTNFKPVSFASISSLEWFDELDSSPETNFDAACDSNFESSLQLPGRTVKHKF